MNINASVSAASVVDTQPVTSSSSSPGFAAAVATSSNTGQQLPVSQNT